MKKKILISIVVIVLLAALFIPIPVGTLNDGGTREYQAITYKMVVWNKNLVDVVDNGDGTQSATPIGAYHKTSLYWFGNAYKDIDELWEIEKTNNDINKYLLPEG